MNYEFILSWLNNWDFVDNFFATILVCKFLEIFLYNK